MKYSLLLVGILLFCAVLFSVFASTHMENVLLEGIDSKLFTAALFAKEILPADYHDRITGPGSVSRSDYDVIVGKYNRLCVKLGLEYLWSLMLVDGRIVFTTSTSPDKIVANQKHASFFEVHSNPELYTNTFQKMTPVFQINNDKWGRVRVALIPYKDIHGRPYLFGASMRLADVDKILFNFMMNTSVMGIIIFVLCLAFIAFFTGSISRPIVKLTQTANRIAEGDYGLTVDGIESSSSKEIFSLSESLNRMSLTIRDKIDEVQRAEGLYRSLVQSSPDGITVMGFDGKLTFVSDQAARMFGLESPEEAVGRSIFDFIAPENRLIAADNIRRMMNKISADGNRYILLRKDGSRFYGEVTGRIIRGRDGGDTGLLNITRDITEKIKTEETLRESERALREAQIIAGLGSYVLEIDKDIWTSSDVLDILFGIDEHYERSVKGWIGIIHPEHRQMMSDYFLNDVIGKIGRFDKEYKIVRMIDGKERWVHGLGELELDKQGIPVKMHGTIQDITERKEMEFTLRESEKALKEAQVISGMGSFSLDIKTGINEFSEPMERIYGIDSSYPRTNEAWIELIHPEHRQMVQDYILNKIIGKKRRFDMDFKIIRKNDGQVRWVRELAEALLNDRGAAVKVLGTIQDITERKKAEDALRESEEKYRLIFSRESDAIVLIDENTLIFIDVNSAAQTLYGYSKAEFLKLTALDLSAEPEKTTNSIEPTLLSTGVKVPLRKHKKKDGTIFIVELSAASFTWNNRQVICAIIRDITEREKAEQVIGKTMQELMQATEDIAVLNETLEKKVRDKIEEIREKDQMMILQSRQATMGEMLRNIAHQWRQPLNALGITVQNIREYFLAGKLDGHFIKKANDRAMRLIDHMSRTIDDFRNFFKPDKEKCDFKIVDSLNRTLDIVEQSLANNSILLVKDLDESVGINGYPNEYGQALLNILNNAKDILIEKKTASPVITIALKLENGRSLLAISDNGGGIPEEIIGKIFEPYFTTKTDGTGIGLYMSKIIIEKNMGGKLSVVSLPDGAEFRVVV